LERLNGWKNSSLVFLFWLFIAFNSTITLRTKIINHINKNNSINIQLILLFYIYYGLTIGSLILAAFSEKYLNENDLKNNQSPEESSGLLSRLTFWWINPLIQTGFKRDLVREDLWKISDKEGSKSTCIKLEHVWNQKANDYIKQMRQLDSNLNNESFIFTKDEQEKLKLNPSKAKNDNKSKISQPSLTFALIKIYFGKFTGIVAIKLTHDVLNFVRPILLE